jgi:hypothetical protein
LLGKKLLKKAFIHREIYGLRREAIDYDGEQLVVPKGISQHTSKLLSNSARSFLMIVCSKMILDVKRPIWKDWGWSFTKSFFEQKTKELYDNTALHFTCREAQ